MSFSHSLSAAEQHTIITSANMAVSRFASVFAENIGSARFFTREDIEDMSQEAAMKAWRSISVFDPAKAKLSTWVSRIAVNCVKDAIDHRMKRLPISASMEEINDDSGDEYNVSERCGRSRSFHPEMQMLVSEYAADSRLNQREFERSVWGEVNRLSDTGRRYVHMLSEGYAPKDMAAIDGCRPNTAAKRVHDVRRALRAALAEVADEYGLAC